MRHPLIREVRAQLRRHADPQKARAMQAYMKSAMPFRGVQTPARRRLQREIFTKHALRDFEQWREVCLSLWREADYREERYAAVGLVGFPPYEEHLTFRALPICEEMIVTGAWWDYADGIAADYLGSLLGKHPAAMKKRMLAWSKSPEMWKRRSAILCQLGFKNQTDLDLLYRCIEATMRESDFFIQKAIGWALRQYARTDPGEVARFVCLHEDDLSTLSKREALRHVSSDGSLRDRMAGRRNRR
jgi:3-methyladenine DNA glycosylase AlkD